MRNVASMPIFALVGLIVFACAGSQNNENLSPTEDQQIAQGARLFVEHCAECHATTAGLVIVGPSLAGIKQIAGTRATEMSAEQYLQQAILEPGAFVVSGFNNGMPGNLVTSAEADVLITYLFSLP